MATQTDSAAGTTLLCRCNEDTLRRLAGAVECNELAERLNRDCMYVSLDRVALGREFEREPDGAWLNGVIGEARAHMFADSVVFVGEAQVRRMGQIVSAVERVVASPAYREHVLSYAPQSAGYTPRALGVFLGYDFHLGAQGPQLIEINTNAGGAFLNAMLLRAQQACCDYVSGLQRATGPILRADNGASSLEDVFVEMFQQEWRAQRGDAPLRTIAIVDEDAPNQYLYPEFLLFQRLFERRAMTAMICDPAQLRYDRGELYFGDTRIDLVYNRLTDFALDAPEHSALRLAYLADAAVVTPHPRAHALYADKRNLIPLTDAGALDRFEVDAATRDVLLSGIPRTERVRREEAQTLWSRRKQLFFKPAAGYGSRAAYRGDKLTRRVFEAILEGNYVAQALVAPSARRVKVDAQALDLKVDLRNYVYRGDVQLISARLYRGQTTNLRTPGGGFAPVLTVPCV